MTTLPEIELPDPDTGEFSFTDHDQQKKKLDALPEDIRSCVQLCKDTGAGAIKAGDTYLLLYKDGDAYSLWGGRQITDQEHQLVKDAVDVVLVFTYEQKGIKHDAEPLSKYILPTDQESIADRHPGAVN